MRLRLLALVAAALAGTAASAPGPAAPASAVRDWTQTVAPTPEGGFRMGNPDAPVKLVEYGSLACPTCARFAAESAVPLAAQVKSGRVSFEFRNLVLNGADMAAAMLSRCAGPASYFRLNHAFFTAQPQWMAKLQAAPSVRVAALDNLPPEQQPAAIAALAGFEAIAARGGIPAAKAKQCLADGAMMERLATMRRMAWATYRIAGTPNFLVNGVKVDHAHSWAELAPNLRPPGD